MSISHLSIHCYLSPFNWLQLTTIRRFDTDTTIAITIFDQKQFKKKHQGFLGVTNYRLGDLLLDVFNEGIIESMKPVNNHAGANRI